MKTPSKNDIRLVVGGESRIDLLPPEVRTQAKSKANRRVLAGVVLLSVALVGAGYGATFFAVGASESALAGEQGRTTALLNQQKDYIEVRQVQDQLTMVSAAKQIGASTEIDWQAHMAEVEAALSDGAAIKAVTVQANTPLAALPASESSLDKPRVATISYEIASPNLPDIPDLLDRLSQITGYVEAVPGSIALDESGVYLVNLDINVDERILSNRFVPETSNTQGDGS